MPRWHSRSVANWYEAHESRDLLSFALGAAFGRWDIRVASGDVLPLPQQDFFSPLPVGSPAQFRGPSGMPVSRADEEALRDEGRWAYPIPIQWGGLLVDDPGHQLDVETKVREVLEIGWSERMTKLEEEASDVLGVRTLREYICKPSGFFTDHLNRYSKSRRKAPIYWQLATPSASYAVWCYYHRLTRDTFFRVANDCVMPKVEHEDRKLNTLRQEYGPDPSSKQRKEIDTQETFVAELRAFLTEVERIAPLWNPNLNDGVIINFAPLWRLVPQNKAWQKECKKAWDKLVKGDYDWTHLAMHLWPERVVPKCLDDRSLAIAHGLEDDFWIQDGDEKWHKCKPPEGGWDQYTQQVVEERSSPGVQAALTSLLEAPTLGSRTTGTKRRSKSGAS